MSEPASLPAPDAFAADDEARPRQVGRSSSSPRIILDLSRLISRTGFAAPTGVDRVEMAYARRLLELAPDRLGFAAAHPCGLYGRLDQRRACALLDETLRIWRGERPAPRQFFGRADALMRTLPDPARRPDEADGRPRVYLQVSPHNLDRPGRMRRILASERARLVCLVHDLIPIEFPEYARPGGGARHARRMATVAELAEAVVAPTEAARRSLLAHFGDAFAGDRVRVAPLGVDPPPAPTAQLSARPYFVAVGTIEPRKNHLLLLNLWRSLVETLGAERAPRLVLVGRRGWENENILDMLDRCPALAAVIEERGQASDTQMCALVQGARALLAPSFAEGFGLPVAEALRMGAPVICSDIAAHREVAGEAADYLDPLDGPGWRRAVLDYAAPGSPRRAAQLRRLAGWRAPTWEAHLETVLDLIEAVGRGRPAMARP